MFGIEYWFDDICKIWGSIKVDNLTVESFVLSKMPEKVTKTPCALSFVTRGDSAYSRGGSSTGVYHGMTEFHLTLDTLRSKMPFCMKFPDKIIAAAAAHLTLGGKVTDFHLEQIGSWELVELTWGGEAEHFGIKVPWVVQESHTGKFTIGV